MFTTFTTWFHKPFTQDMSPMDVILVTGLVIIGSMFWFFMLNKLRGELT